jgi:hypothetical protein
MDNMQQKLRPILGHTMADAVALHRQQETAGLDPLWRGALLPLLDYAADKAKGWV